MKMPKEGSMKRSLVIGSSGNLGKAMMAAAEGLGWEAIGACRATGFDVRAPRELPEGEFDLVVFAQGVQEKVMLPEVDEEKAVNILDSHLLGSVLTTAALVREEKLKKGALIVYCSSIQAVAPRPGRILYAAAKAGLEGLARAVAAELAPDVRAVALRLGQFEHSMKGIRFSPEDMEYLKSRPLSRDLIPEQEIASFIISLYDHPHVNGAVIDMSGGHLLNIW